MDNKATVRKLLGLLKEYKSTIAVIMVCLLGSTGLNLCIPLISRQIMDVGFIGGNKDILIALVLGSMAIRMVNYAIEILKEKKRVDICAKLRYSLSEQSFFHLMKLKIGYFNNTNYAEILSNVNTDIDRISSVADGSVFFVVTQAFSMTGGIIGLFIIDYRMTLLVLLFIPVKFIVMKNFAKKQKRIVDEYIMTSQNYARWFGNTVGGVREVKLFSIFDKKHEEFIQNQGSVIEKQKQLDMLSQWNSVIDLVMIQLLSTVLYILGANLVFGLQMSVGSVFAFITYSAYVTGPISAILNIGYLLSGIIPSTKRFYEFMDLEEEGVNADCLVKPQNGDIEFEDVSFAYNEENTVVEHVNLQIKQGNKIIFIGKNGSGKSTLINLLLRMYEPSAGRILLACQNIAHMPLDDYRSMISVVSQEIYLFNDTIRNNICLYKQVDDHIIQNICKDSGLEAFLNEVSLDYTVGQNGTMLSGGQKQKIALARALLHDRPIVVFDEATSSTDSYSEQQINSLLHTKLKDKTVIVVTHKQEILSEADCIVMLDEGKIVGQGSYEHIKKCERYLDMMNVNP